MRIPSTYICKETVVFRLGSVPDPNQPAHVLLEAIYAPDESGGERLLWDIPDRVAQLVTNTKMNETLNS